MLAGAVQWRHSCSLSRKHAPVGIPKLCDGRELGGMEDETGALCALRVLGFWGRSGHSRPLNVGWVRGIARPYSIRGHWTPVKH